MGLSHLGVWAALIWDRSLDLVAAIYITASRNTTFVSTNDMFSACVNIKMLLLNTVSKCVIPQANIDKEDMVRTT